MIPREALEGVKKIIVHANGATSPCADGRASAIILRCAFPEAEIVEMAYQSPEHNELRAEPGLLFCDFTPPRERLDEFVSARAIVLDHHDPELVKPFGERGMFGASSAGECGATLALRGCATDGILCRGVEHIAWMHKLASYASIRDTWKKDDWRWERACEWASALRFFSLEELLEMSWSDIERMCSSVGKRLREKEMEEARELARTALHVGNIWNVWERRAVGVWIIPSLKTSDVADLVLPRDERASVLAGFGFVHEPLADGREKMRRKLVVSLRSRNFDVQRCATFHGGGGHKEAAGFAIEYEGTRVVQGPYAAILDALAIG